MKCLSTDAKTPVYATPKSAGMDVFCLNDFSLRPGQRMKINIGLALQVAEGFRTRILRSILRFFGWDVVYQIEVRPRSGLADKYGISIVNAPGTIDEDYTGEVGVLLVNLGSSEIPFKAKDKIAQLVVSIALRPRLVDWKGELASTQRGAGGFGSTGR